MTQTEASDEFLAGQSELYVSAAHAYRAAYLAGACESDCRSDAVKAVRDLHPFLLEKEADRLARRVIAQFSELYPEWLSK